MSPALRPYLVRHESEAAEARVDGRNPADAAELHGDALSQSAGLHALAQTAGRWNGTHFEVRMFDGTTTYVRPADAPATTEVA